MQSWIALPKMPTIFEWCSGDIVGDFKAVTTVINPNMYDEMIPTFIMQRRIQMMAWNGSHAQTEMAQSLGDQWSNETVRLCKKYLNGQMPVGIWKVI